MDRFAIRGHTGRANGLKLLLWSQALLLTRGEAFPGPMPSPMRSIESTGRKAPIRGTWARLLNIYIYDIIYE
jgi:hypothetical protein